MPSGSTSLEFSLTARVMCARDETWVHKGAKYLTASLRVGSRDDPQQCGTWHPCGTHVGRQLLIVDVRDIPRPGWVQKDENRGTGHLALLFDRDEWATADHTLSVLAVKLAVEIHL